MAGAMSREARLWLIRHAPVDGPRGVIHAPDAPADLGNTQRLAVLRAGLPADGAAYCSPARRTVETALALGLHPLREAAFREQGFGAWTGRRHDEIARELGPAAYEEFWRSPAHNRPPGGESFVDQIARVAAGLAALPDGDAILVVHSGTIRAALAVALDIAPESALRFVVDPLSLTRIDRLDRTWRIGAVNRS
jgi:alpha-ribazole phosphatase